MAGFEEGGDEGNGKADDVVVAAFDAGNPAGGAALDGVGSRLVHGLAGGDIAGDVLIGKGEELDGGGFCGYFDVVGGNEGDAGDDAMGAAGEKTEHAGGVGGVFGLAEDVIVEGYGGVGAQHLQWGRRSLVARSGFCDFGEDGFGFFAGQAGDVGDGVFVGVRVFGDVGGVDLEREAGLGEEFAAARGG